MTSSPESSATPPPSSSNEGVRITLPGQATPQERWLWRGLILVLCLLAYVPALNTRSFIWDDNRHANTSTLRDVDGLVSIWTRLGLENGGTAQYYPLTHTTYWLEYQLFGRFSPAYHAVNVIIHAGAAVLLWELLRRLRAPGAFLAALIFALHPLMVESVAWTSERKNTLSLLLALAFLYFYTRFVNLKENDTDPDELTPQGVPDFNLFFIAALCFVGAMLSKTVAGSAAIVLLLILWWKRKLDARQFGMIAPLLAIAALLSTVTAYTEYAYVIRGDATNKIDGLSAWLTARLTGSLPSPGAEFEMPFAQRLMLAGMIPWFYLFKFAVGYIPWLSNFGNPPAAIDNIFFYPRWDFDHAPAFWWLGIVSLLAVIGFAAFLASKGKRWPLVIVLGYLGALFPAMGFVDVYPFRYSYVADHFAYHAIPLLIVAFAAGIAIAARKLSPTASIATVAALCFVLGARTYSHSGHFFNNFELFKHTYTQNPTSWAAAQNWAIEYINDALEARKVQRQAIERNEPKLAEEANSEARQNLANARRLLDDTLRLNPDNEWADFNLARVALYEGNRDEALERFQKSLDHRAKVSSRDGPYAPTYEFIAEIYAGRRDWPTALEYYNKAIAAEAPPMQPMVPTRRMLVLESMTRVVQAQLARAATMPTTMVNDATTQSPTQATTQATTRLARRGPTTRQINDLVAAAKAATDTNPKNAKAWIMAGEAMATLGIASEAAVAYGEAIRREPGSTDAVIGYGEMLATLGDLDGAKLAFAQALRLSPNRNDAKQLLEQTNRLISLRPPTTRSATQPSSRPATTAPASR